MSFFAGRITRSGNNFRFGWSNYSLMSVYTDDWYWGSNRRTVNNIEPEFYVRVIFREVGGELRFLLATNLLPLAATSSSSHHTMLLNLWPGRHEAGRTWTRYLSLLFLVSLSRCMFSPWFPYPYTHSTHTPVLVVSLARRTDNQNVE